MSNPPTAEQLRNAASLLRFCRGEMPPERYVALADMCDRAGKLIEELQKRAPPEGCTWLEVETESGLVIRRLFKQGGGETFQVSPATEVSRVIARGETLEEAIAAAKEAETDAP